MRPLEGVTVLDLTRLLPGPFCGWLLRSWGARVVKVEDPAAGDYLRELQPVWFDQLNRGAESITLDLKRSAGREVFLKFAARVDMVLEGFRPGVMDRLGIGYGALSQANPRLVLVSLSGFGADGPLAERAGHDINYLARSGLLSLMTELPPVQLGDLGGGLTAAAGALAALVGARTTGKGAHVETSLLDALFALGSMQAAEALAGSPPARGQMLLAGAIGCYNVYETADGGSVTLGALEPKFWRSFCEEAGRPDLIARQFDPSVKADLAELFRSQPLSRWAALAGQGNLCLEPVLSMSEAVADRTSLQPVSFNGFRPHSEEPPPERGAHTYRFLREAGLTEQELAALAAEAVIPEK